ncbi:unnamed protein product [Rotaria sp. Silwood2]|nr:unnamed protein product [Rotaria sp. Silwood2]
MDDSEITSYQSFCDPLKNNGECSNNIDCRCLTVVSTGDQICTPHVECSRATPCNSTDKCDQNDSICVKDNQCNGQHFCYPAAWTSPDICPPLATNENINNGE